MRPGLVLSMTALLAGGLSAGCATVKRPMQAAPALPSPLAIEQVAVEPKTLDFRRPGEAAVRYTLSRPAVVSVELLDDANHLIRSINAGHQGAGPQRASWDGRREEGVPAFNGVYRYVIRARETNGREILYDPSQEMGGEELEVRNFQWDPEGNRFRWVMPKAGYARLRVGIEGFPHLRTLLDWEPIEAGEQTLTWDGLDTSGHIQIKNHPHLSIKLAAFAMAPNTVIVKGADSLRNGRSTGPTALAQNPRVPGYLHARHPRTQCRELHLRVEFPGAQEAGQGRPILQGKVPVRISLQAEDVAWMINERFEVAVFEDLTVIFEEEEGLSPFTYEWDTGHLPPGQHLLTVNILGHDDHFGVETKTVWIGASS